MIRQNDQRDSFERLRYGSVISYPAGKDHVYKDYLILGKTDDEITTVPLLSQNQHKMNRFDVPLSDGLNADLGDSYFTSTLNVNMIQKSDYDKVNSVHILDLDQREIKTHDQKTSVQIALAKKQYHLWLSIENSNVPITRKHQALRRGLNKQRILTKSTLEKYLLGKQLVGNSENDDYDVSAYIDQTYNGTIAKDDPNANLAGCNKYANVDKLRKYDVIRYRAITGDRVKWRPFLVMGQDGKSVDLVPITHSRYNKQFDDNRNFYSIYHVNLSPEVSKAISIMNGDRREQAENAKTALSPCTQVTVKLDMFKERQLPQYLGNLQDYASMKSITQMENKKNDAIKSLMTSYENYQIENKALGRVRNYRTKLFNRQSVSPEDVHKIINKEAFGKFAKEMNLAPVNDGYYQRLRDNDQVTYGVYQSSQFKKPKQIETNKPQVYKKDLDEMEV